MSDWGVTVDDAYAAIDEQRDFWDGWLASNHMRHLTEVQLARGVRVVEALRELAPPGARILEIGCAHGWLCKELVRLGAVVGTDLSRVAIEAARDLVPEATFLEGDFLSLELGDDAFEAVVCLESIAYMDQPAFVSRVAELLVPGGHLIVTTPNWPTWEKIGWKRSSSSRIEANHFGMAALKELLAPRFDIVRSTSILPAGDRGWRRVVNSRKVNRAIGAVVPQRRLDDIKGRLGLGQTLFVVGRRRPEHVHA